MPREIDDFRRLSERPERGFVRKLIEQRFNKPCPMHPGKHTNKFGRCKHYAQCLEAGDDRCPAIEEWPGTG